MLDEEDSLGLPTLKPDGQDRWLPSSDSGDSNRALRIAVIALPSFSNFTDFDALRAETSVSLHLCRDSEQLSQADIIIVPGSKQTATAGSLSEAKPRVDVPRKVVVISVSPTVAGRLFTACRL